MSSREQLADDETIRLYERRIDDERGMLTDRPAGRDASAAAATIGVNDGFAYRTQWLREAWTEEACEFARNKLLARGVTVVENGTVMKPTRRIDRVASAALGRPVHEAVAVPRLVRVDREVPSHVLRALVGAPDDGEATVHGNLLLNEGIQLMLDKLIGAAGTTAANATAQVGVGDSTTAASAAQTDLQAATNKLFKGMNATFPSRASQTMTWQSDFGSSEANFAWQEASVRNDSTADKNINRVVSSLGTKATGTWTLSVAITIS